MASTWPPPDAAASLVNPFTVGTNSAAPPSAAAASSSSHHTSHHSAHAHASRTPPRRASFPGGQPLFVKVDPVLPAASSSSFDHDLPSEHTKRGSAMTSRLWLVIAAGLLLFAAAWHVRQGDMEVFRLEQHQPAWPPTHHPAVDDTNVRMPLQLEEATAKLEADMQATKNLYAPSISTLTTVTPSPPSTPPSPRPQPLTARISSEPHFVIRILSSGTSHHAELDRLLQSLAAAKYDAGIDLIDLEILVDLPPVMVAGPSQVRPEIYRTAKEEYELHLVFARNFPWIHGAVTVRAIEPTTVQLGGFFHAFTSWTPPPSSATPGGIEEFALVLRDTSVVSPHYFQVIKRLLQSHFLPGTPLADSWRASADDVPLLVGLVLEQPEMVLGVPSDGQPGGGETYKFRKAEPVLLQALTASDNGPHLIYTQLLNSFSLTSGLLLRSSMFLAWKQWLVDQRYLVKDPTGTPATQDYGAPVALIYDRNVTPTPAAPPCVPGMISNEWIQPPASAKSDAIARQRVNDPWFVLMLLERFLWERGMFALTPIWKDGKALVSSAAFQATHTHIAGHAFSASVAGGADDAAELARVHQESAWTPTAPLKRELVAEFDAAAYDRNPPAPATTVVDVAGQFVSVAEAARQLKHTAVGADACTPVLGAPSRPPTNGPTSKQLDAMEKQQREFEAKLMGTKAKTTTPPPKKAKDDSKTSAATTTPKAAPAKAKPTEVKPEAFIPPPPKAAAAPATKDSKAPTPPKPEPFTPSSAALSPEQFGGSSDALPSTADSDEGDVPLPDLATEPPPAPPALPEVDLTGLSQQQILEMALKTAEAHQSDLPSFPGSSTILPASQIFDNLTSIEVARWDAYESEFQFQLQTIAANEQERTRAMAQHEAERVRHEAHLAHIRDEVEKKNLVDTLHLQLEAIRQKEADQAEEALVRKYREKKAAVQKAKQQKEKEEREKKKKAEKEQAEKDLAKAKAEEEKERKENEKQEAEEAKKKKKEGGDGGGESAGKELTEEEKKKQSADEKVKQAKDEQTKQEKAAASTDVQSTSAGSASPPTDADGVLTEEAYLRIMHERKERLKAKNAAVAAGKGKKARMRRRLMAISR